MRAKNALAWYIAAEVSAARGDTDVEYFLKNADAEALKLIQREQKLAVQRQQWVIPDIPPQPGLSNNAAVSVPLNMARVRLNRINQKAGDYLTSSQEWTQQATNAGWKKMQEFLASIKLSDMQSEVTLTGLPACSSSDPTILVSISWAGYFNGSSLSATLQLPQNLVRPTRLWERPSGSNAGWTPMDPNVTGLGTPPKQARNYAWQWRGGAIWMPGATATTDVRVEFSQAFSDFVSIGSTPWYLQQIPIARAEEALSWYICAEVAASVQGDPDIDPNSLIDPAKFIERAESEAKMLLSRDVQALEERGEWTVPDIPAQAASSAFDFAGTILNEARVRLNQLAKLAGDTLSPGKPFVQQYFNGAWRKLQGFLRTKDFSSLKQEVVIDAVPVVQDDPGNFVSLSWGGYWNGVSASPTPALPSDLIRPIRVWERPTFSSAAPTIIGQTMTGADSPVGSLTVSYAPQQGNSLIVGVSFRGGTITSVVANDGTELTQDSGVTFGTWGFPNTTGFYRYEGVPSGITSVAITVAYSGAPATWYLVAGAIEVQGSVTPDGVDNTGSYNSAGGLWKTGPVTTAGSIDLVLGIFSSEFNFTSPTAKSPYVLGALYDTSYQCGGFASLSTTSPGVYTPNGTNTSFSFGAAIAYKAASPGIFTPMEQSQTGLGSQPKQPRNFAWQWRANALWMLGSTAVMDIRVEYLRQLPDFVNTTVPWWQQQVPIAQVQDTLAWYICAEVAIARPDLNVDFDEMKQRAEDAATELCTNDAAAATGRGEWPVPNIPEAQGDTPYDVASVIMNAAQVRLNRVSQAAGDVIAFEKPFTQKYFNIGYRRLQEFLQNMGYLTLENRAIIQSIPPVVVSDPAILCYLSWSGYFDGLTLHPSITLPSDLIVPLECWERWSGQNARFRVMQNNIDGLGMESQYKVTQIGQWQWLADQILFPGSQQTEDMLIRYKKYLPDLVLQGSTPWYLQEVPIARCQDPLSLFICAEVARARPDLGLGYEELKLEAESKAKLIFNRDVAANQRVNVRRQPRSGRGMGGGRMGWCGYI
jgi:hypothetical protein